MGRNPLLDLLAALLPMPERDGLVRRGAEPAGWSLALGFVELFLGAKLLLSNALTSFRLMADQTATYVMEKVDPQQFNSFDSKMALTMSGPIMWLTWAARPATWLLASIPIIGLARLIAFGVSREAVGEPLVWFVLRVTKAVGRLFGASQRQMRYGPERPDRVMSEPGSDLVVLSGRPKPDWNERVTIEIGERFYRLQRTEERQDGVWWAHAYLLREADPGEVIRGLVRYEPPAAPRQRRPGGGPLRS